MDSTNLISIFTDGAARGNPGPAAVAFLIVHNNKILHKQSFFMGNQTNNQAEYHAIIKALEIAKDFTKENIVLFSDSELVIKQLNGEYQVRNPHLKTLHNKVATRVKYFSSIKFSHVSRTNQWIKKADRLCNDLLDQEGK